MAQTKKTTKTTTKKTTPKVQTEQVKPQQVEEKVIEDVQPVVVQEVAPVVEVVRKKKVVFIATEAAPFIATGGLADVIGSLPKAIAKNGNFEVGVILPLYSKISREWRDKFKYLTNFNVQLSWRWQYCGVFTYEYEGVKFYFVDNEYYFRREGNIYGHYDDAERFSFFSKAAIDVIQNLNLCPDVIHCHDWQTAASIIYLKSLYFTNDVLRNAKAVFTIHNIEYQGKYGLELFSDLFGFPYSVRQLVEYDKCINLMKGAIEMADRVSTVSPTYANEIKNNYFAHGLAPIINKNAWKLRGILNGIDYEFYNPANDIHLFGHYTPDDMSGKAVCKEELQKMLGLPQRKDVPLIAMITRLVSHKGLDLVKCVIENILSDDVQFVILGTGDSMYENFFTNIANAYWDKCRTIIAFNSALSRQIYSGADIFLMPSKMEPCGLSQMIASRYATVPVVREVGGLNDSIKPFDGNGGNGFTFKDYNAHDMLYVVNQAIRHYRDTNLWDSLRKISMQVDFSWKAQAYEYEKMYND